MPKPLLRPLIYTAGLFLALAPALAQDPQPAQAQDADAVTTRITELEAVDAPDEDQKIELVELKAAVALRQKTAASEANTAKLAEQASSAPGRLEQAQADLTQAQEDAEEPLALDLPPAPAAGTADELRAALAPVEARLKSAQALEQAAQQVLDEARKNAADAEARAPALPGEIAEATTGREEVDPLVAGITADPNAAPVEQAKNSNLRARQAALAAKLAELDQELKTFEGTKALRQVLIDLAEARAAQAQRVVSAVQKELDARKLAIATTSAAEAGQASREALSEHEVVRAVLDQNAALATEHEDLIRSQTSWNERRAEVADLHKKWQTLYAGTAEQVRRVGLIDAMGLRLRNLSVQLGGLSAYEDLSAQVWSEVKRAQSRSIELDRPAGEPGEEALRLLDASQEAVSASVREEVLQAAEAGLVQQQEFENKLEAGYQTYTDDTLLAMHDELEKLASLRSEFLDYIQERILWVQSVAPIQRADLARIRESLVWLFDWQKWSEVGAAAARHASQRPARTALLFLPFALLLALRNFMRRRLDRYGERVRRTATDRFSYTLGAALITLLLSLRIPVLLWALAELIAGPELTGSFGQACSTALDAILKPVFSVTLVTAVCRPQGLAAAHFGWRPEPLALVRSNIRLLAASVLPTIFFLKLTDTEALHVYHDSLGRVAFCVSNLGAAYFFWRVLPRAEVIFARLRTDETQGWTTRMRPLWVPVLIAICVAAGVAACSGYFLTAQELAHRVLRSLWVIGATMVLFHILMRALYVTQRRQDLAQRQRLEGEGRTAEEDGAGSEREPPTSPQEEELELDVEAVSGQTRQLLATALTVLVLVNLYFVWSAILPALQVLENIAVWTPRGVVATITEDGRKILPPQVITLADLGLALIYIVATFQIARNIPGALEALMLRRMRMSAGARYTARTLVRYAIVILGVMLTFDALGIGWGKLQWMAAAVSVGLGFGMQEIFANFVSGLIILTERPIRLGDTVTVANVSGTVERIQMRATTVADWDKKELIIPNKAFVTGSIVNWTLSNAVTRVKIPIGVAYDSDTEAVERLLIESAKNDKDVLVDPGPCAFLIAFGSDALNYELRIFIEDVDSLSSIRDRVNKSIIAAFREADIEIAFPQRDIHVRSIDTPLPFTRDGEPLAPTPGTVPRDPAGSGDTKTS